MFCSLRSIETFGMVGPLAHIQSAVIALHLFNLYYGLHLGLLCFCFLFWLWQDAQEFLRCIMDQLHEELKQPVPLLVEDSESSDSDDDEPNHHNKRLLGGTSLPHSKNLQNGMRIYSLLEQCSKSEGSQVKKLTRSAT